MHRVSILKIATGICSKRITSLKNTKNNGYSDTDINLYAEQLGGTIEGTNCTAEP